MAREDQPAEDQPAEPDKGQPRSWDYSKKPLEAGGMQIFWAFGVGLVFLLLGSVLLLMLWAKMR
jgi:hypothetical protein